MSTNYNMILCSSAVYTYTTLLYTITIRLNNYGYIYIYIYIYIYKYNYILYRLIAMTDNLKLLLSLTLQQIDIRTGRFSPWTLVS